MHEALALVQRIGGPGLLDRVITLFRASAEERRVRLAIKGSAAQVGAEGLRAVAASLEKEVCTLDAEALNARFERIVEEMAAASAQLDAYRHTVVEAL